MLSKLFSSISYAIERGSLKPKFMMGKGELLEREIFDKLYKIRGKKRILVDLYIPFKGKGGSSQLDLVLIHGSGIYVIEAKNYNCVIRGNVEDNQWSATYGNGKSYDMYNPILQNANHIKLLEGVLKDYKGVYYKSLVVFGEGSKVNIKVSRGIEKDEKIKYEVKLVTVSDLVEEVNKIGGRKEKLSNLEINNVYSKLSKYARQGKGVKRKHTEYVKTKVS